MGGVHEPNAQAAEAWQVTQGFEHVCREGAAERERPESGQASQPAEVAGGGFLEVKLEAGEEG